ncbi:hypothetical protein [Thalassolituus maritimus]|uniref:Uncharacterized protein n=1 Tax=Thalassolituus maritimus TaxID=484498 RepID=A0ABP9ZZH6_9GAMM
MLRRNPNAKFRVSRARLRRSVASSTAIETGEPTEVIEARLNSGKRRFKHLTLCLKPESNEP